MPQKKRGANGKLLCEDGMSCKYIHEYQHSLEFCHEFMPSNAQYDWSKGGGGHKLGGGVSNARNARTTLGSSNGSNSNSSSFSGKSYRLGNDSGDSGSSATSYSHGTRVTTLGSPTALIYHPEPPLSRGITIGKSNSHNSILSIGTDSSLTSASGLGEKQICAQCKHVVYMKFWDDHCRIMHPCGNALGSSFAPSSSSSLSWMNDSRVAINSNATVTTCDDNDERIQCGVCFKIIDIMELAGHMEMHENIASTNHPLSSRGENASASSSSNDSNRRSAVASSSPPDTSSSEIHIIPKKRSRKKKRSGLGIMPSSSEDDDSDYDVDNQRGRAKKDVNDIQGDRKDVDFTTSDPITNDATAASKVEIIDLT